VIGPHKVGALLESENVEVVGVHGSRFSLASPIDIRAVFVGFSGAAHNGGIEETKSEGVQDDPSDFEGWKQVVGADPWIRLGAPSGPEILPSLTGLSKIGRQILARLLKRGTKFLDLVKTSLGGFVEHAATLVAHAMKRLAVLLLKRVGGGAAFGSMRREKLAQFRRSFMMLLSHAAHELLGVMPQCFGRFLDIGERLAAPIDRVREMIGEFLHPIRETGHRCSPLESLATVIPTIMPSSP